MGTDDFRGESIGECHINSTNGNCNNVVKSEGYSLPIRIPGATPNHRGASDFANGPRTLQNNCYGGRDVGVENFSGTLTDSRECAECREPEEGFSPSPTKSLMDRLVFSIGRPKDPSGLCNRHADPTQHEKYQNDEHSLYQYYHHQQQQHHHQSQWDTEGLLSCSPMVTGPRRSIHLPNLDLRRAMREEMLLADPPNATSGFRASDSVLALRRSRSRSLGDMNDKKASSIQNNISDGSKQFLLGKETVVPIKSGDPSISRDGRIENDNGLTNIRPWNEFDPILGESPNGVNQHTSHCRHGYGTHGVSPLIPPSEAEVDGFVKSDRCFNSNLTTITSQSSGALTDGPNSPLSSKSSFDCGIPGAEDERTTPIDKSPYPTTTNSVPPLNFQPNPSPYHSNQSSYKSQHSHHSQQSSQNNEYSFENILNSVLYGFVNSSIVLPILMSFGSIIYHDEFFRPYLSTLMKLTVISGAVHQITFSTVSSLPFAVGQVQDAGLIFLSGMAKDLVAKLRGLGYGRGDDDDVVILATVTIGLSIYTAILGMSLILVGKFKLASYCQLLPSSVVGGYLAYIGFFCGQAGLASMAMVDVSGISDWYKFFNKEALVLLMPGVLGGLGIYFAVGKIRHMAVLPTCIALLLAVFYAVLWETGTTLEEATDNGWVNKTAESTAWYHTWDYLRIDKVVWTVLPTQIPTLLAMISVVALSSSLDIAAIEIELKRPLDYDHELKTVGISNIISGFTGGYTGSYIFSQTIFSLRIGIRSRLMGYVIAVLSIITVVIPFNILSYIPNFFFGSLLMMICLDLMFEWLIDVRKKVTSAEYAVLLVTFALLQIFGVEFGILAGVLLYVAIQRMGYDVGNDVKLNEDDMAIISYGTPMGSQHGD